MEDIKFNGPHSEICKLFWKTLKNKRPDIYNDLSCSERAVAIGRSINIALRLLEENQAEKIAELENTITDLEYTIFKFHQPEDLDVDIYDCNLDREY